MDLLHEAAEGKKKSTRGKPLWNDSVTDLSIYKLSKTELEKKQKARESENRALAVAELSDPYFKQMVESNPKHYEQVSAQLLRELSYSRRKLKSSEKDGSFDTTVGPTSSTTAAEVLEELSPRITHAINQARILLNKERDVIIPTPVNISVMYAPKNVKQDPSQDNDLTLSESPSSSPHSNHSRAHSNGLLHSDDEKYENPAGGDNSYSAITSQSNETFMKSIMDQQEQLYKLEEQLNEERHLREELEQDVNVLKRDFFKYFTIAEERLSRIEQTAEERSTLFAQTITKLWHHGERDCSKTAAGTATARQTSNACWQSSPVGLELSSSPPEIISPNLSAIPNHSRVE